MKLEYFLRKISKRNVELLEDRVVEKFQVKSVKRLDGFVLCIQDWRETPSSKFFASWKHLRIVDKGRTFSYKYFGFRREI